jgi:hypothetical protein
MSLKKPPNNFTNQTALKLLNQYANSYHLLESQITSLKQENKDLKSNLQINKEIIQTFFQGTSHEQSINDFHSKLKQENAILQSKLKHLESQINFLQNNKELNITNYTDKIEQFQSKIFLLENLLQEKETQITILKKATIQPTTTTNKKGNNFNIQHYLHNKNGIKEIYVSSPTVLLKSLNEELQYEKEINKKLLHQIQIYKQSLSKKEKQIQENEKQLTQFKQEITKYKQDKTNLNIISQLTQYRLATKQNSTTNSNNNTNSNTNNNNISITTNSSSTLVQKRLNKSTGIIQTTDSLSHGSSSMNKSKRSLLNQIDRLEQVNKTKRKIHDNHFDLTEEWYETLKYCNMSQEEFLKYCTNKQFTQLTDVIEYLYKLLLDKNIQIKLLTEENDSLNLENLKISKKLLELSEGIERLVNGKVDMKGKSLLGDGSTIVNVGNSNSNVIDNDGVNMNIALDYIKEVKQSITSSEFQEGMILDQFDLVSEMSKDQGHKDKYDVSEIDKQSNGGNVNNKNNKKDNVEIHLNNHYKKNNNNHQIYTLYKQ